MNQMERHLINSVCKNDFMQAKKIAKDNAAEIERGDWYEPWCELLGHE